MKQFIALFLISVSVCCYGQPMNNKGQTKKAIICLTYDDAIESQLYVAIPQLDSLGFKGTFFMNSIKGSTEVMGIGEPHILGWKKAAQNGHELANHTLFHPCPEQFGWQKELALERYSIDKMLKEIEITNLYLGMLDDTRKVRSFAFPCNNFAINGIDYVERLRTTKLVTYARGGGDRNSCVSVPDFKTVNIMKVPSWHVEEGTSLEELIAFAEKVKANGGLGIYQFHGIDSPLFRISSKTHKRFLAYLKANQNEYWVTTFSEAMDYVTDKATK